jgi:dolichol-phosphate mannosyltransferase
MSNTNATSKMPNMRNKSLSVVIPVFNEEQVIKFSLETVFKILDSMAIDYEVIVVDDGSNDKTFEIVKSEAKLNSNLRLIKLNKNYGHMEALKVGMSNCSGEAILTIDADLQDPPEYIPLMFTKLNEAISGDPKIQFCVQTFREDRKVDSFFKRSTAFLYYWLIKKISGVKVIPDAADYRILSRSANQMLLENYRRGSVFRLDIPYLEIPTLLVPIVRHKRFAGESKYTNKKMLQLTLNSILSFNQRPLRLLSISGLVISLMMFLFALLITVLSFFSNVIPGWTSLVLIMLSSNAFIVFMIGFLGSYVGRIYENLQNQPISFWTEYNPKE